MSEIRRINFLTGVFAAIAIFAAVISILFAISDRNNETRGQEEHTMRTEYTATQRRELAQKLREISDVLLRSDYDEAEDWADTIDQAIALICPGFLEEEDAALDADLNSPEMDAFMDGLKKDPSYQKGFEEFKELTQKVVPFRKPKDGGKH